jgi:hypothetical protein
MVSNIPSAPLSPPTPGSTLTYDGTTLRTYLNGSSYGTPLSLDIPAFSGPVNIGVWCCYEGQMYDFFSGTIDEARIYNYALSSSQVQTAMNTPISGAIGILGDLNGDGIVNSLDWSIMNSKWLTSDPQADINGDGIVNSLDWSIMNANWLKTS